MKDRTIRTWLCGVVLCLFGYPLAAMATSPVFVDPAGVCNGEADCFTTIQEGVNNATDPDAPLGGATAEVFVFPGTYVESVDLSNMGSAVAGAAGDIRLVTVDAAGVETPGTATVNPATGKAFQNTVVPFPGNVTLDGFTVLSVDDSGIVLTVSGSLQIANVAASENANYGMFLEAVSDILVTSTTANRNGLSGVDMESGGGAVTITDSTAIDNDSSGFNAGGFPSIVAISGCTSGDNGFHGISANSTGAVSVSACDSINNAERGYSLTAAGPVAIIDSVAYVNGKEGFRFDNNATTVDIINCDSSINEEAGFIFNATGDVLLRHTFADGNDAVGVNLNGQARVTIESCGFSDNQTSGFAAETAGFAEVRDTVAHGNGNFGILLDATLGASIESSDADDNAGRGMLLATQASAMAIECGANGNGQQGLQFAVRNDTTAESCTANGNGEHGILIDSFDGGLMTVIGCNANNNQMDGVHIEPSGSGVVSVFDTTASGNSGYGIRTLVTEVTVARATTHRNSEAGVSIFNANGPVTLRSSSSQGNASYGYEFEIAGPYELNVFDSTAHRNSFAGIWVNSDPGGDVRIDRATVTETTGHGIHIVEGEVVFILDSQVRGNLGEGILLGGAVYGSVHHVIGSIICQNLQNGMSVVPNIQVDAAGNWWGHPTGPQHTSNGSVGLGDGVQDGANGGGGVVDFDPWIDTVTANVIPATATVGEMVDVTFQFSGGAGLVFLGSGPGDPSGQPPFTLTTDNGELTGSLGSGAVIMDFITQPNGVLAATLVPAVAGAANVTLVGPCGVEAVATLNVNAQPDPEPEPEPMPDPEPEPPQSQPSMDGDMADGAADCGAGLCGVGSLAMVPLMLFGLGLIRGRVGGRRSRS